MSANTWIRRLTEQEQLNFLLTNRIPRRLVTRFMGWFSKIRVRWIKGAVGSFEPEQNRVLLEDSHPVYYDRQIVAPGIKLDWHGVEGLVETLGRNGVTSNYRYDLAPYTWELVKGMRKGRALFTQPPSASFASASLSEKSMTMKPSIRSRLTTTRPGRFRGPEGAAPSYWLMAPQQTTRPRSFMAKRAVSSTCPPTLSK